MNTKLQVWIEGAIAAAVAMALSYIPIELPNAAFDLSVGMIPIAVFFVRRGVGPGIAAGLVWGLLHLILGKFYIMTIPQVILEYPVAFALTGLGGVFSKSIKTELKASGDKAKRKIIWLICGAGLLSTFVRWFCHYWAGVFAWSSYAGDMNPYIYSLIMNGASFIANAVMVIVVLSIIATAAPRLFRT